MSIIITPPADSEYPEFFKNYINVAKTDDLLAGLEASGAYMILFVKGLTEEQLLFRYQEGKWSVKELLVHLMDGERIFAYRSLRFARQDKTELPGFEENAFVGPSKADARTAESILTEYAAVRTATIELFRSFDEEALSQSGVGNGNRITVRALGYSILGHEVHHLNIIKERYLKQ